MGTPPRATELRASKYMARQFMGPSGGSIGAPLSSFGASRKALKRSARSSRVSALATSQVDADRPRTTGRRTIRIPAPLSRWGTAPRELCTQSHDAAARMWASPSSGAGRAPLIPAGHAAHIAAEPEQELKHVAKRKTYLVPGLEPLEENASPGVLGLGHGPVLENVVASLVQVAEQVGLLPEPQPGAFLKWRVRPILLPSAIHGGDPPRVDQLRHSPFRTVIVRPTVRDALGCGAELSGSCRRPETFVKVDLPLSALKMALKRLTPSSRKNSSLVDLSTCSIYRKIRPISRVSPTSRPSPWQARL